MNPQEQSPSPPQGIQLHQIVGIFLISRVSFWIFAELQGVSFIDGICAWDCNWYTKIAIGGYDHQPHAGMSGNAANWPFFPLYPLLMHLLHLVLPLSIKWIGVLLSNVCILGAILLSLKYLHRTRSKVDPFLWVFLC